VILLVDGERTVREDVASAIGDRSLTTVSTVEAARAALSEHPDLVVVDWSLPDDAASEVVEAITADGDSNSPFSIALLEERSTVDPGVLGVDEVVTKPVEPDALRGAVERGELLGAYDDAIESFYRLSQAYATREPVDAPDRGELRRARERADDQLRAVDRSQEGKDVFEHLLQRARPSRLKF